MILVPHNCSDKACRVLAVFFIIQYPHRIATWRTGWVVESIAAVYSATRFPTLLGCCRALPLHMLPLKSHVVLWLCRGRSLRADYLTFPYVPYIHAENITVHVNMMCYSVWKTCLCGFMISLAECLVSMEYLKVTYISYDFQQTCILKWPTYTAEQQENVVTSGQLLGELT